MIESKSFALAEALVFVHGLNARAEAERHLTSFSNDSDPAIVHLWEDVVHILPVAMARPKRFQPFAQTEGIAATC